MTDKFINKVIVFLVGLVFVILPILINPLGFSVFALPRVFFLYLVSLVLLVLILYQNLKKKNIKIEYNIFHLLSLVFLFFIVVSVVFSKHKYTALWGYDADYEGLFTWLSYLFFFLIGYLYFRNEKSIKYLFASLAITSLLVSVYAILQYFFDWQLMDWVQKTEIARASSFLGHPNYLAGYYILILPLIYFLIQQRYFKFWLQVGLRLVFALGVVSLVLTFSRAGWLTFILMLFISGVIYNKKLIISYKKNTKAYLLSFFILIIVSLSVIIAFDVFSLVADRFMSIFDSNTASTKVRVLLYIQSLNLLKNNFLFGIGPDNFAYIIPQYFLPAWGIYTGAVADKAHNQILDYWVSFGIFGLLSYLSIIVFWIYKMITSIKNKLADEKELLIMIFLSVIGYLFFVQINYTTIELAPILWFLIGLGVYNIYRIGLLKSWKFEIKFDQANLRLFVHLVTVVTLVGLLIGLVLTGYKKIAADYYFVKSLKASELNESIHYNEKAINYDPYLTSYYLNLNHRLVSLGELSGDYSYFDKAIANLNYAYNYLPLEYRIHYQQGETYLKLVQYAQTKDYLYQKAKLSYLQTLNLYPNSVESHLKLGVILAELGNDDQAIDYWLKCLELNNQQEKCLYNLSVIHSKVGQQELANEFLDKYNQIKNH